MTEMIRHCPGCGSDQPFEQHHAEPARCQDSAGGYCPEWSCTACGAALLAGSVPFSCEPAGIAEPHRRAA